MARRTKSKRQKRIDKHAKLFDRRRKYRRLAIIISVIVIAIPVYMEYYYGG